jgi:hypothetical protein
VSYLGRKLHNECSSFCSNIVLQLHRVVLSGTFNLTGGSIKTLLR